MTDDMVCCVCGVKWPCGRAFVYGGPYRPPLVQALGENWWYCIHCAYPPKYITVTVCSASSVLS